MSLLPTYDEVAAHIQMMWTTHYFVADEIPQNDDLDLILQHFDVNRVQLAIHDIRASKLWRPLKAITTRYGTSYGHRSTEQTGRGWP